MRKLLIPFLSVFLLAGCKSCNKSGDPGTRETTAPIAATANVDSTGLPKNLNGQVMVLDTITINGRLFHLDSITQAEYDAVNAFEPDTNLPAEIKRTENELRLSLLNGDSILLQNEPFDDYEKGSEYTFEGNFKEVGYWYIYEGIYEGIINLMINQHNGKTAWLTGEPQQSPNKKYWINQISRKAPLYCCKSMEVMKQIC